MDSGSQLPLIDGPATCDMDVAAYNCSSSSSPFSLSSSDVPAKKKVRKNEPISAMAKSGATSPPSMNVSSSHKRPLSNINNGSMGLKEMLCSTGMLSHNNNKLAGSEDTNLQQAKRIKCDDSGRGTTSSMALGTSQLLEQLMAPAKASSQNLGVGQGRHSRAAGAASNRRGEGGGDRNNNEENVFCSGKAATDPEVFNYNKRQQQHQQQQAVAPSNSVLMNLLVSGCDVSAGYMCLAPIRPRKTAKV